MDIKPDKHAPTTKMPADIQAAPAKMTNEDLASEFGVNVSTLQH